MIQLPNVNDTKDPVLQKVILAVQELSDKASGRDTALLEQIAENQREMKTEMKELRSELKTEMKELRTELKTEMKGLKDEVHTLNQKFDTQTDLLRQLVENTKPH